MRLPASRPSHSGSAAAATGYGARTTTTAASARYTASRETRSLCSVSRPTLPSQARARPFSHGMRSARTASRTGPARRGRSSTRPRDGRICLQWCTGAPGVVAGAWEYLDENLLLAGAELIWRAGAHRDEKGHGLCHGTSGNGFALLKAFARTGDEHWLERARRFAVHALAQAERIAAANGRRRYSLFNGDVGTALFAAACLDADPRFPIVDVM